MNRFILVLPVLVAGCSTGIQLPDFRTSGDRLGGGQTPVATAPAPMPAPPVLTAKERLIAAIESNDCMLTADNVGTILNTATIGTAELRTLTAELNNEGRVEVAGNGAIRATTGACATT